MDIIKLKDVSKSYWEGGQVRKPLDDISLDIKQGELVVLQGKNGAGKTTLINLILGLQKLDSGTINVFDHLPQEPESRLKIGCMLQKARVPDSITIEELINLVRSYYPSSLSTDELLTRANLQNKRHDWASKLSGGQERSLYFALAIAGNPEFLILDEPTRDLDVHANEKFWQQVRDFSNQGKTILVINHIESDQKRISDLVTRTITLEDGKLHEVYTEKYEELEEKFLQSNNDPQARQLSKFTLFAFRLLGQTKFEMVRLIRQPIFLFSILTIYGFAAFFPKDDANPLSYITGLAAINSLLIATEKFGVGIAAEREQGWTKLLRVTPLPAWIYLAAKIITTVMIFVVGLGFMFGFGIFKVGITEPPSVWLILFLSLVLGVLPFAILGFGIGYLLNAKSVSLFTTLILGSALFSSGLPMPGMPEWLQNLIPFSPFYHYSQLIMWAGNIRTSGIYDGHLSLHLAWLTWTAGIASFLAVWAYQRERAMG